MMKNIFKKNPYIRHLEILYLATMNQRLIYGLTSYSQYHLCKSKFNYRVEVLEPAALWL